MLLPRVDQSIIFLWILHFIKGDTLISGPPINTEANQGSEVQFNCQVEVPPHLNADQLKVKWKHNGIYVYPGDKDGFTVDSSDLNRRKTEKYIGDDKGQILTIRNVERKDAGIYSCIVHIGINRDLASAKLDVREPPESPRDVSIIACVGNSVELQWTPGGDGGAKIQHYLVQFNTSANIAEWHNYYDLINGTLQTVLVNLSPWGTYKFRLLAKNEVGYSKPSSPTKTECTTPPERPAGNPKDVRTLTHKKGKLIVTWTPMSRLQHNGPGFQYAIFWRRKGSTYWNENIVQHQMEKIWEVNVNDTYTLYEIKVKAMNQIGESRQPAFVYLGYSGEGEPSVIPKDFRLDPTKPVEAHKAHFIWEAVDTSEDKIRGEFMGYKLRYWKSSEGRHKWKEVDILITKEDHYRPDVRAAIDGLPAHTALRAQVSVMNTHYTGPASQVIDLLTPEGVPSPVRDLRIDKHGTTYALLKWLPPEEPNGKLLGYDIGYQQITDAKQGPVKALRPQINNPDSLGARITGLESNHDYRFYVWARTQAGRGDPEYTDVTTKEGTRGDAHLYQQDEAYSPPLSGASSLQFSSFLSTFSVRTCYLLIQTLPALLTLLHFFH